MSPDIDKKIDSEHSLIRKTLRRKRQTITREQQALAAEKLCQSLIEDSEFRSAESLAFYQAFDGEIDPSACLSKARELGKSCYLPVLDNHNTALVFVKFDAETALKPNQFGIPEPVVEPDKIIALSDLDIIYMPLLAFDRLGTRLGMGQGYYDRTLADIQDRSRYPKPRLIGLAHECQRVEKLERASWDVPLDKIITDQAVYQIKL